MISDVVKLRPHTEKFLQFSCLASKISSVSFALDDLHERMDELRKIANAPPLQNIYGIKNRIFLSLKPWNVVLASGIKSIYCSWNGTAKK